VIGENCRALGFNVDFAPVLDLAFEASRSVMSSRAVSDDPKQVVAYAREFLRGLGDAGVLGCGKHFPGLGEATLDTHHELPSVEKPLRKLWDEDLVPYRRYCCGANCRSSWFRTPRFRRSLKERTPASLSKKWITDILRKKIGYRGLICSDDLEMGGVLAAARLSRRTYRAHPRRRRSWPDLPSGRFHSARARSAGRERSATQVCPPRAGIARRVLAFKKKFLPEGIAPHAAFPLPHESRS
jgi:beta-N-acetylhexosaminidase